MTARIPTGFFNCEFYVGLKPYKDKVWGQGPIRNKAELTEDLQKKLAAYPGVIFNYTQPAEDAVDEALTGLKSALAVKIYGEDLQVLESKAVEIKRVLSQVPGFTELTVVRELGQPSVQVDVDREKIARYGINVSDVEGVVQAGVGGQAATQVIQGERLFDLVVRMKPEYRSSTKEIGNLLVPTPSGQQVPISELATITQGNGASFIYRENNSRYIGVQFSIEGRDLARAVDEAQKAVRAIRGVATGLHARLGWRVQRVRGRKITICDHWTSRGASDFHDSFRALRQFQVPGHRDDRCNYDRAGRSADRAETNPHAAQRQLRARSARVAWRFSGDRCHPGFLYQQAAPAKSGHPQRHARSSIVAPATHHDDGAGRVPWPLARGAFHWNRIGYAKTVRHRRGCGPDFAPVPRLFRKPGAVRDGGQTGRRFAGVIQESM